MKILVACEYSGVVREAFAAKGHDVWSCDIIPTEQPGQHIINDVRNVLDAGWDMMIAHPPCEKMSDAGIRWFKVDPDRMRQAQEAFKFFMLLVNADIPMIAVENPRGLAWRWYKYPDQVVQPYMFGDGVTKRTGLWLKNLPPLMASLVISDPFVNWTKKGKMSHNGKTRSKTFPGIAAAMAAQWGKP